MKWNILHTSSDNEKITEKDIIRILLQNRGLKNKKEIEMFLYPDLQTLSPENIGLNKKELDKAFKRILAAIENKESIIVYTDYDVDGICAGALVWETLFNLGARVLPYVPHREKEGYGLSEKGIEFIKREYDTQLIITVDHGISAAEKISFAKSLNIDTIVIDHHVKPSKLPKTSALVHSTKMCAGGIAWIFTRFLNEKFGKKVITRQDLELAALATIADLIPLQGPNRAIVHFGLQQLNQSKRIGLIELLKEAGLTRGKIDVYQVSHIIAPRLNAVGRLSHAMDALRLICTKDRERAAKLAKSIGSTNRERQLLTEQSVFQAIDTVKKDKKAKDKLLFISHESFRQGVIGLIAGKLVSEFYLPSVVISKGSVYSKASARSITGFNIVEAIRRAHHLLVDVGGHPMAAGFTVETGKLEELKERLLEIAESAITDEMLTKTIPVDVEIPLSLITMNLYERLKDFAPFGVGNPAPTFLTRNVRVLGASLVGKDQQHLKMTLTRESGQPVPAISFNSANIYGSLRESRHADIVYTVDLDKWNGNSSLQLKLRDVSIPSF